MTNDAFDIQPEMLLLKYTSQEIVSVQSSTVTTTVLLLTALINDIADGLGLNGDIRNASVQFNDINTNLS